MAGPAFGARPAVSVAFFQADVTPALGAPLCLGLVDPAKQIVDPLTARGVVLHPAGQAPIVLCAVDWVTIAAEGHDDWRTELAKAAGTDAKRVAVHTLHQHDAPGYDPGAERLMAAQGASGEIFHLESTRKALRNTAEAVREARRAPATHIAIGKAEVREVASNRRVLGADGKVKYVRYSATRDAAARAEPEGLVDRTLRQIAFFNGAKPLGVLTYYATHPQSYYGKGGVSWDFVGMAREMRAKALGIPHVHFNGASGNVTAGKYNDGAPENRAALASRLADGMREAWESAVKEPLTANSVAWYSSPLRLPNRDADTREQGARIIADKSRPLRERLNWARDMVSFERLPSGKMDLAALTLGSARVIHLPGESFIEYQLAAQQMRPANFVCTAAYGDCSPGYIGTTVSYGQGGYEVRRVSRTAPEVEGVLMGAMREILSR